MPVGADETRLRIVRDKGGKTKNGFVWTFGARDGAGGLDVAYVFTEDRSGSTPKTLLEGTTGVLLVDGYMARCAPRTSPRAGYKFRPVAIEGKVRERR